MCVGFSSRVFPLLVRTISRPEQRVWEAAQGAMTQTGHFSAG